MIYISYLQPQVKFLILATSAQYPVPPFLYGAGQLLVCRALPESGCQRFHLPWASQSLARENPQVSAGLLKHLKWLGVAIFDYAAQQGAFNPESKNPFSDVAIPRTQHIPKPSRYATLDDVV